MDASQLITDLSFAIQSIVAGTAAVFEGRIKKEWLIYNVRLPGNSLFINLQYRFKKNGIVRLEEKDQNTRFLFPKKVAVKASQVSDFQEISENVRNVEESSGTFAAFEEIEEIRGDTLGDDKAELHPSEIKNQPAKIPVKNSTLDLNSASNHSHEYSDDETMIEGKGEIELKIVKISNKEKRNIMNQSKRFRCKCCKERFDTLLEKESHETIHKGQNRFSCEVCKRWFRYLSKLNEHKKTHKEKRYCCDYCGKSYFSSSCLNKHIEKNHLNERRSFRCEFCNKSFKRKDGIKEHLRIHTGERPYNCEYCGKSFNRLSILHVHRRMHKAERPFVCFSCGKCFTVSSGLIRYQKTQTGKRLYKCEYCEKTFVQLDHLTAHTRLHTGRRPYYCNPCWKSFIQKNNSTNDQGNEDVNTSSVAAKNEINS